MKGDPERSFSRWLRDATWLAEDLGLEPHSDEWRRFILDEGRKVGWNAAVLAARIDKPMRL